MRITSTISRVMLLCAMAFLLLGMSTDASAQLLTDQFNYTASATLGLNTQSSGAWLLLNSGDSILVDAGSLSYTGLAPSAGNKVKFDGTGSDAARTITSQSSALRCFFSRVRRLFRWCGSVMRPGSFSVVVVLCR